MFCPTCGKSIPEDAAFCSNCGKGLPKIETTTDDASSTLEQASRKASSGFDTKGPLPVSNQKRNNAIVAIVTIAIVAIVGVIIYNQDNGGGGLFGTTRNCIRSVLGNPPECSDCSQSYESTNMNGKYYGNCSAISGNYSYSDVCNLSCK